MSVPVEGYRPNVRTRREMLAFLGNLGLGTGAALFTGGCGDLLGGENQEVGGIVKNITPEATVSPLGTPLKAGEALDLHPTATRSPRPTTTVTSTPEATGVSRQSTPESTPIQTARPTESPRATQTGQPTPTAKPTEAPIQEPTLPQQTPVNTPKPVEQTPAPTPKAVEATPASKVEQGPSGVGFIFENVPDQYKEFIVEDSNYASSYYDRNMGIAAGPISVKVINDPAMRSGVTKGNLSTINTGSSSKWPTYPPEYRRAFVSHEVWHAKTFAVSGAQLSRVGPWHIEEGLAEYAGNMTNVARGIWTPDFLTGDFIRRIRTGQRLPSLGELSAATSPTESFALAALSMDFLTKGRGAGLLGEYVRNLKVLQPPQAFEKAFGESMQSFQARFEEYRRTLNI